MRAARCGFAGDVAASVGEDVGTRSADASITGGAGRFAGWAASFTGAFGGSAETAVPSVRIATAIAANRARIIVSIASTSRYSRDGFRLLSVNG